MPAAPYYQRPQSTVQRSSGLVIIRTIPSFRRKWYPLSQGYSGLDALRRVMRIVSSTATGIGGEFAASQILRLHLSECLSSSIVRSATVPSTAMRRSAIRALKGSVSATHAPKSVSRSFATVRDPRQKVHPYDPVHWNVCSSVLGSRRTRSNYRTSKWHSCGH